MRLMTASGSSISSLGLGTVKFGRNQQVKYPQEFKIPDDTTVKKILSTAQDLGINLLDTAPAYGYSEERLGKLLPGQRCHWHIATKVGEEFDQGESRFDFSEKHIRLSIERSLKRLRTDYLDTVLIHSHGDDLQLIQSHGVLDILADIKKKGLVRYMGMSTKTVAGGLLALDYSDLVMATYNLQHTEEEAILKKAAQHDKAIFIKKAFASGHIASLDMRRATLQKIFSFPAVTSVIIGTVNVQHLQDNAALLKTVAINN